jgi:hypothetical protein
MISDFGRSNKEQAMKDYKIINTIAYRGFRNGLKRRFELMKSIHNGNVTSNDLLSDFIVIRYRKICKGIYLFYTNNDYLPDHANSKLLESEREVMIQHAIDSLIHRRY